LRNLKENLRGGGSECGANKSSEGEEPIGGTKNMRGEQTQRRSSPMSLQQLPKRAKKNGEGKGPIKNKERVHRNLRSEDEVGKTKQVQK